MVTFLVCLFLIVLAISGELLNNRPEKSRGSATVDKNNISRAKYLDYLTQNSLYFNNLSDKAKQKFLRRIEKFIAQKEFIPRGMPTVPQDLQLLIATAATQIAFGFPEIYLQHFWRILVYPSEYRSTITNQIHKGEVNMGGLIVFSYSHLEEGVSDPADGINLALHEMAHALHIENSIKNREFGFIDSSALGRLKELFYQELEHLQSGESNFLRTYAGENFHEFFAVCVENFFERPAAFYAQKPEVFRSLSQVLNQNPLVPA